VPGQLFEFPATASGSAEAVNHGRIKLDAAAAATPPDSPKCCNSSPAGWPATARLAASLEEFGGDPAYGIQDLHAANGSFSCSAAATAGPSWSHDRSSATAPINQICSRRELCCHASLGTQNDGSARQVGPNVRH
jgi:hypothetical protein